MAMVPGMGRDNPKIKLMEARSDPAVYVKFWKVPLCGTCSADCPCECCSAHQNLATPLILANHSTVCCYALLW